MTTDAIREAAESLEDYGSSRANFRHLDSAKRQAVARMLVIARSQAQSSGNSYECDKWEAQPFRREMHKKKNRYFYTCGQVDISRDEATYIWWNFVYEESPAPFERGRKYI